MTCGTCKHWSPLNESKANRVHSAPLPEYGTCEAIVHGDSSGGDTAYTVDGSDYFSALRCKASFGCVLWEKA
jgi:hypothetical protein